MLSRLTDCSGLRTPSVRPKSLFRERPEWRLVLPDRQRLLNAGIQPCNEGRDAEGFGMDPDGF